MRTFSLPPLTIHSVDAASASRRVHGAGDAADRELSSGRGAARATRARGAIQPGESIVIAGAVSTPLPSAAD
jgi:hypothetical protein